jgi:predicted aspartyl protease
LSILLASAAFVAPAPAATPPKAAKSNAQFEALPLTRSGQNHLLVRAYINEKPALLIVDTGSPGTVINSKRRAYFGLNSAPASMKWPRQVQVNGAFNNLVIAHNLRLGALNVVDVPVVLADMSGARQAARMLHEQQADGILGADALFSTKAILDCQEQVLFLNMYPERAGRMPGLDFRGFQSMPMVMSEGLNFYVDSSINGTAARLMVDTGAFATLLHRPFVRGLHIPVRETRLQSARINLADDDVEVARIRKLSLGLVDILGKQVGVTDLGGVLHNGLQSSPPVVGLLGGEILHRNHAIIDFGTQKLYLRRDTDQPDRPARNSPRSTRSRP